MARDINEALSINLHEAAERVGVSYPTILEWSKREDFPGFRSGRRWVVPVESLKNWLDAQAAARARL